MGGSDARRATIPSGKGWCLFAPTLTCRADRLAEPLRKSATAISLLQGSKAPGKAVSARRLRALPQTLAALQIPGVEGAAVVADREGDKAGEHLRKMICTVQRRALGGGCPAKDLSAWAPWRTSICHPRPPDLGGGGAAPPPPRVTFRRVAGALDSHPVFPSHVASGRCVLLAAAAGALAGVVSVFAQWLVCRGCAGCGMVCRWRVSGAQSLAYWGLCWSLWGSFDCFCRAHASVHRPSITCLSVFPCA